jgi:hypothetical protein
MVIFFVPEWQPVEKIERIKKWRLTYQKKCAIMNETIDC